MQVDPIGYGGGSHLYAYVGNDPLNRIDPLGLAPNSPGGVRNLSAGDILQSYTAGAVNALAQSVVNFGYYSSLGMQAEAGIEPNLTAGPPQAQVMTPVSNYFASEGATTVQGVSTVVGAAGLGRGLAGPGGSTAAISGGDYTFTQTVQEELASRPYINTLTIQEIVATGKGVPDPGGLPGALRYDVPGTLSRSSQPVGSSNATATGTYELVIDPRTNTVYHMLFKSP
jgi:hypothetical protein